MPTAGLIARCGHPTMRRRAKRDSLCKFAAQATRLSQRQIPARLIGIGFCRALGRYYKADESPLFR